MIDDVVVVDAVIHGFNYSPADSGHPAGHLHKVCHAALNPRGEQNAKYLLSAARWEKKYTAEELTSVCFAESQTDIGVYHHVRAMGRRRPLTAGECSPLTVGIEAREMAPGRVFLYAALTDPFDTARSIDEIDRYVEEQRISGLKFYPEDWSASREKLGDFPLDDSKVAFPLLEHAQKRGIKVVAVHKAMGAKLKTFGVADFEGASLAFPKLNFEIVHAGFAFVDETARLACFPNIYLNLEGTSAFLGVAPKRFADVLGRFLLGIVNEPGAQDRILWATGTILVHPQPLLELFWKFKMPEDLMEDYGYPEVTKEIKRKILGENWARMHGLDLKKLASQIPDSEARRNQLAGKLAQPWAKVPLS